MKLERILCIDDDKDMLAILAFALEQNSDWCIKTCNSGLEAIESVPVFEPQLLIISVMMSGMSGPQTDQEIRKIEGFNLIPTIFMTANPSYASYAEANPPTLLSVISKPFDTTTFSDKIQKIWDDNFNF